MASAKTFANRILFTTLGINLGLMGFKFYAALRANSQAMFSDGVHTLSDVFTTVVVIVGMALARRERDKSHPYGHERLESVTGLFLAMVLAGTALFIGRQGVSGILGFMRGEGQDMAVPGPLALVAAGVSIAVQEMMYQLARYGGKKLGSTAMMADAWHHRSDALSSVGALAGIGMARLGYPVFDPIASLIICLFILWAAVSIARLAIRQLVDHQAPREVTGPIRAYIESVPGVLHIDEMRSRLHGSRIFVDVEIAALHTLSFEQAHQVSEAVHQGLEANFPDIVHCTVHANPHHACGEAVEMPPLEMPQPPKEE